MVNYGVPRYFSNQRWQRYDVNFQKIFSESAVMNVKKFCHLLLRKQFLFSRSFVVRIVDVGNFIYIATMNIKNGEVHLTLR